MPAQSPRTLSAQRWIGVYWLCFAACVAVTGLLVLMAPRLTRFGLTGYVVYLVLVPLGLGAAGFLFGALRSLAQYEGKFWFGALRLGGPAAIFALVVMGGLVFGAPVPTYQLVVHVHGPGGADDLVRQGNVRLTLGQDTRVAPIDLNGSAYFPEIPAKFRGLPIEARAEVAGFRNREPGPHPFPDDGVLTLEVEKARYSSTVSGTVLDSGGQPLAGVAINIENGLAVAQTDALGNFRVELPLAGEERLTADQGLPKRGRERYDFNGALSPWNASAIDE